MKALPAAARQLQEGVIQSLGFRARVLGGLWWGFGFGVLGLGF